MSRKVMLFSIILPKQMNCFVFIAKIIIPMTFSTQIVNKRTPKYKNKWVKRQGKFANYYGISVKD